MAKTYYKNVGEQVTQAESDAAIATIPIPQNLEFGGWSETLGGKNPVTFPITITEDKTFYPIMRLPNVFPSVLATPHDIGATVDSWAIGVFPSHSDENDFYCKIQTTAEAIALGISPLVEFTTKGDDGARGYIMGPVNFGIIDLTQIQTSATYMVKESRDEYQDVTFYMTITKNGTEYTFRFYMLNDRDFTGSGLPFALTDNVSPGDAMQIGAKLNKGMNLPPYADYPYTPFMYYFPFVSKP